MTAILLYLAAGLLLLACLLRLLLGADNETREGNTENRGIHAFGCAEGSALHIARQLFGREDWQYVRSLDSKTLESRFLKERTALALLWLGAARSEAHALMRVHRAAASTSPHLNLAAESRIVSVYVAFLFYCALLEIVIRVRGPVALQNFVAMTDARSIRLYEAVGQVFPFGQRAEDEWQQQGAAGQGGH